MGSASEIRKTSARSCGTQWSAPAVTKATTTSPRDADEREQGITIDVAYRYFTNPKRKFVIADTPGHIQYARNVITGASTANLAIVLVDARKGLVEQSRRHAFLVTSLRVPHLVLAVNKMDFVDYSQDIYNKIHAEFTDFAAKLDIADLTVIPISALHGGNVVIRSDQTPW
jgi:bifunctional enzyme CysN/CysC